MVYIFQWLQKMQTKQTLTFGTEVKNARALSFVQNKISCRNSQPCIILLTTHSTYADGRFIYKQIRVLKKFVPRILDYKQLQYFVPCSKMLSCIIIVQVVVYLNYYLSCIKLVLQKLTIGTLFNKASPRLLVQNWASL